MNPGLAFFLFGLSVLSDIVWAKWTLAIAEHHALAGAIWSGVIAIMGAAYVDAYVHSRWYVIPIACGAALGTYLAVRFSKKKP